MADELALSPAAGLLEDVPEEEDEEAIGLHELFELCFLWGGEGDGDVVLEFAVESAVDHAESILKLIASGGDGDDLMDEAAVDALVGHAMLAHTLTMNTSFGPPFGRRRRRRAVSFPVTRRLYNLMALSVYSVFAYYALFAQKRKLVLNAAARLNPGNARDLLLDGNVITSLPAKLAATADALTRSNYTLVASMVQGVNAAVFVSLNLTSGEYAPGLFWKYNTLVQRYSAVGDDSFGGFVTNVTAKSGMYFHVMLPYAEFYAAQRLKSEAAVLALPGLGSLMLKCVRMSARFALMSTRDVVLGRPDVAAALVVAGGTIMFYAGGVRRGRHVEEAEAEAEDETR